MTLSIMQRTARRRVDKQRRITMLCNRLDRQVAYAEKFKRGATRDGYLKKAEITREQLRQLEH
jgi:hypothetical protein